MIAKLPESAAFWWTIAILSGLISIIPVSFYMNADGICYMNIASLYQRGEFSAAINGFWSPLYSILIAIAFKVIPTSPYFESAVVHGLNFLIYLGAFAAFRFFLANLRATQAVSTGADSHEFFSVSFSVAVEIILAHALFFWAMLALIELYSVTPDILVALLVFLAAGLSLKVRRTGNVAGYVGLGVVLGIAYLAKAVMFPIGITMCVFCAVPAPVSAATKRSMLALAGFFLVASPQLVAMSRLAGHLSYGEAGKIAYAHEVNLVPMKWVGDPPGSGTPVHPMRLISQTPPAFEFATSDVTMSYPASDQLAYWAQGVRPHFSAQEQLRVTARIVKWYIDKFKLLVFAALLLYLLKRRTKTTYVSLIVPALATFALYSLVHAEPRFVGAWVVVLSLCFIASLRFDRDVTRSVLAISAAIAIYCSMAVLTYVVKQGVQIVAMMEKGVSHPQLETAAALRELGVGQGSRVATIGNSFNAYWARLANVQIAMQVPDDKAYSSATESERANVIRSFRDAGAVAVVSTGKPIAGAGEDWQPVGAAGYWVLMLKPTRSVPATD